MSDKFKFSEENKRDLRLDLETWQSRNFGYDWIVKAIEDNVNNRIESIIQDRGNSIQDGASAEDVFTWLTKYKAEHPECFVTYGTTGIMLKAFAQSETAKVVAEKDREISELKEFANYRIKLSDSLTSQLAAHITELSAANERIRSLEEYLNPSKNIHGVDKKDSHEFFKAITKNAGRRD